MAKYPNERFLDEIDEVGYNLTMEILHMQLDHRSPDITKDAMRSILEEFAQKRFDKGFMAAMEVNSNE